MTVFLQKVVVVVALEKTPPHRQSGAKPWGVALLNPVLRQRRLAGCQLTIWDAPKRRLPGNQEASVYAAIFLPAIVVTLEPGKATLYIPVYPSTINLGHSHDKNTKQRQQSYFDHY